MPQRGLPGQEARRVDAHRDVGEPEPDGLVLDDRLAELDALARVGDGVLVGGARDADAARRRARRASGRTSA